MTVWGVRVLTQLKVQLSCSSVLRCGTHAGRSITTCTHDPFVLPFSLLLMKGTQVVLLQQTHTHSTKPRVHSDALTPGLMIYLYPHTIEQKPLRVILHTFPQNVTLIHLHEVEEQTEKTSGCWLVSAFHSKMWSLKSIACIFFLSSCRSVSYLMPAGEIMPGQQSLFSLEPVFLDRSSQSKCCRLWSFSFNWL